MPPFLTGIAARIIIGIVLALILLLSVKSCVDGRKAGEQGKQAQKEATASTETARDAAATVISNADENASLDDLIEATQEEIQNATDSKVSRSTAIDAICRMHNGSKPLGC